MDTVWAVVSTALLILAFFLFSFIVCLGLHNLRHEEGG
jgi:hypothetical protein